MTRIIAGQLKGSVLKVPKQIRPMMELVRKALFDILGPEIVDAKVLELFGGSGAISFEAISRGAQSAIVVEKSHSAISAIKENIDRLKLSDVINARLDDAMSFLNTNDEIFDIIIADPPYELTPSLDWSALPKHLTIGWFILSHAHRAPAPIIGGLTIIKQSTYGDTTLTFYQSANS